MVGIALLVKGLHNPEYCDHDVNRTIPLVPEFIELLHRPVDVALEACPDNSLDNNGVWLVAYFEDVVAGDKAKPRVCGLEVVDRLSHVPL